MEIKIKLMGMLKEKTPSDGVLQLSDGASIEDALMALEIPTDSVNVFMVNGSIERDRGRVLAAGDDVMILPPVGGG